LGTVPTRDPFMRVSPVRGSHRSFAEAETGTREIEPHEIPAHGSKANHSSIASTATDVALASLLRPASVASTGHSGQRNGRSAQTEARATLTAALTPTPIELASAGLCSVWMANSQLRRQERNYSRSCESTESASAARRHSAQRRKPPADDGHCANFEKPIRRPISHAAIGV